LDRQLPARRVAWIVVGVAALVVVALLVLAWSPWSGGIEASETGQQAADRQEADAQQAQQTGVIAVTRERQEALGIRSAEVRPGSVAQVFDAPSQVVPDEAQHAYITPRAPGVVREVFV